MLYGKTFTYEVSSWPGKKVGATILFSSITTAA